jgi:RNA polymerase sigma-70 factor, ECF subfamily
VSDQRQRPSPSDAAGAPSFEALVQEEAPRLFAALRLIARDRAEAEEVLQRALLKAWARWREVQTMSDPGTYLFRTAMSLFPKGLRRMVPARPRRRSRSPSAQRIAEMEASDEVLRALSALTREQRQSLVLTDLLGFPSKVVGDMMGIRASKVRSLASQGRGELKLRLEPADA